MKSLTREEMIAWIRALNPEACFTVIAHDGVTVKWHSHFKDQEDLCKLSSAAQQVLDLSRAAAAAATPYRVH